MEQVTMYTKVISASIGGLLGAWLGGWDVLLKIFVALTVLDFLTGLLASWIEGKRIESKISFKTIPKKLMMFMMIAVGQIIDIAIGDGSMFRNATIFFYGANELISIIENSKRAGKPPEIFTKAVEFFKSKSGDN